MLKKSPYSGNNLFHPFSLPFDQLEENYSLRPVAYVYPTESFLVFETNVRDGKFEKNVQSSFLFIQQLDYFQ